MSQQAAFSGNPDLWRLKELDIQLLLPSRRPNDKQSLFQKAYMGPGPFMASNVRFVVITQLVTPTDKDQNTYLLIRVIPRSTRGYATFAMCAVMTFCAARLQHPPARRYRRGAHDDYRELHNWQRSFEEERYCNQLCIGNRPEVVGCRAGRG